MSLPDISTAKMPASFPSPQRRRRGKPSEVIENFSSNPDESSDSPESMPEEKKEDDKPVLSPAEQNRKIAEHFRKKRQEIDVLKHRKALQKVINRGKQAGFPAYFFNGVKMTLIIEDGSGVPGANSYVTVDEAKDYYDLRGLTYPEEEKDFEQFLVRGADWLNGLPFHGNKLYQGNSMAWPRKNAFVDGALIPEDIIPQQIKSAQIEFSHMLYSGATPFEPAEPGKRIQRESYLNGLKDISYFDDGAEVKYPAIDIFLRDYVIPSGTITKYDIGTLI